MLKLACGSSGSARCGCGLLQARRALHVGPAHKYAGHAPVRLHVPVMSGVLICVGASSAKRDERKQSWRLLDRAAAAMACTHHAPRGACAARTRHNQHQKPQVNAALATKNGGLNTVYVCFVSRPVGLCIALHLNRLGGALFQVAARAEVENNTERLATSCRRAASISSPCAKMRSGIILEMSESYFENSTM